MYQELFDSDVLFHVSKNVCCVLEEKAFTVCDTASKIPLSRVSGMGKSDFWIRWRYRIVASDEWCVMFRVVVRVTSVGRVLVCSHYLTAVDFLIAGKGIACAYHIMP